MKTDRGHSFGQGYRLSPIDRFGIWLSGYQFRRHVKDFSNKIVADIGCGYQAGFGKSIFNKVAKIYLVDITLEDSLKTHNKVIAKEGYLPDILNTIPDSSIEIIICNSVLEHVWEPEQVIKEFFRILKPTQGICMINVPSWRGKLFLEFSAFKLKLSPADEMEDHKNYYNPNELWKVIRKGGFHPSGIKCFTHKFGLNVFGVCRKK